MSRWTHLAGIIRIDNFIQAVRLPGMGKPIDEHRILQKAKAGMPSGSEGPVMMHVHVWKRRDISDFDWNGIDTISDGSIYWGDLIISGDLRDRGDDPEDVPKMAKWFRELVQSLKDMGGLMVRQAVLNIEVESLSRTTISFDSMSEKWNSQSWQEDDLI